MKYALAFATSFVLAWFIILPDVATSKSLAIPMDVSAGGDRR